MKKRLTIFIGVLIMSLFMIPSDSTLEASPPDGYPYCQASCYSIYIYCQQSCYPYGGASCQQQCTDQFAVCYQACSQ